MAGERDVLAEAFAEALLTYDPPDPIPAGGWSRLMPNSDEARRILLALRAAPSPEPLDVERLLATLTDRFHEARAGTPEWRDGIRLGLQIAMNEVSYALSPDRPTSP